MIKFPFFFLDFKNFHTLFCMYMYFIQYSRFTQNDTSTRDRYFNFTNLSRQQLKHFWHSLFMSHTFRGSKILLWCCLLGYHFFCSLSFLSLYFTLSLFAGSFYLVFLYMFIILFVKTLLKLCYYYDDGIRFFDILFL